MVIGSAHFWVGGGGVRKAGSRNEPSMQSVDQLHHRPTAPSTKCNAPAETHGFSIDILQFDQYFPKTFTLTLYFSGFHVTVTLLRHRTLFPSLCNKSLLGGNIWTHYIDIITEHKDTKFFNPGLLVTRLCFQPQPIISSWFFNLDPGSVTAIER